ncbi:MAG: 2,3,4,5-tetrahydropyridine-2,6-dicarboxylate N-succinyltransferase [Deltaproteobacteria bacterium]|nr:2,3,4,5-tetrahydropyridine-2,6-dicarboxylate N-succinyltransferase [Deltaproteobacteria bacterium]
MNELNELNELKTKMEAIEADPTLLERDEYRQAVHATVAALDQGKVRVAEKRDNEWVVNTWTKQAILHYFRIAEMKLMEVGPFEFFDKIPLKRGFKSLGVRVVPPGTARFGSFLERGVVLMPGYVNIGAYVGAGTMVDTWATVGSCAQIGKGVHLSGGVGIGGVLEPLGAKPVIIEDGAFIGSRCIVVEGLLVEQEAVLGANVTLTASTPIIDVTGDEEVITKGCIPARSVVIPGSRLKRFPAGEYAAPCALIIGHRKASTDRKTSLNDVLREFALTV